MKTTAQLNVLLKNFNKAVQECGGEAELIKKIIEPIDWQNHRKQSCWIDACPQDREKYEELGNTAHINDYCCECAEKIVKEILAKYPELKDEVYINDDGVDADSAPSCFKCGSLITYRLLNPDEELYCKLYYSFDPAVISDAYELHRLIEDCETDISDEKMRKLAFRTFYFSQAN